MNHLWALVLAAGEGKRMRSRLPKVLHPLCGKIMLEYVLQSAAELTDNILVVVGHGALQVRRAIGDGWNTILQEKRLGTGHAVMQAFEDLPRKGVLLVLCGDVPLLDSSSLQNLLDLFQGHAAVVATTEVPDPFGYGRVIRDKNGLVEKIVEESDTSESEKKISEINTGTYCFNLELLRYYLPKVTTDNNQQEYYLPDVLELMRRDGYTVGAFCLDDYRLGLGINDREQLSAAESILQQKKFRTLMRDGVTIENPGSSRIDIDVQVGSGTVIRPGCLLEKGTVIGSDCYIGPGAHLVAAVIKDRAAVYNSVIENSVIEKEASVGPFEYICRDDTKK